MRAVIDNDERIRLEALAEKHSLVSATKDDKDRRIREYAARYPEEQNRDIANRFGVGIKRVRRALRCRR